MLKFLYSVVTRNPVRTLAVSLVAYPNETINVITGVCRLVHSIGYTKTIILIKLFMLLKK